MIESIINKLDLAPDQMVAVKDLLQVGTDEELPRAYMANVLAQVHHETGGGMTPIKETVMPWHKNKNPTDATVRSRLEKAWASGKLPWVKTPYWRDNFFGRGQIQLTHRVNYAKMGRMLGVDLVNNPDIALDSEISAKIAVIGMKRGLFTGKKLAQFDRKNGFDHRGARAIVNGDVVQVGPKIEKLAEQYEAVLKAAGWPEHWPHEVDTQKAGAIATVAATGAAATVAASWNVWVTAAIVAVVIAIFIIKRMHK